MIKSHREPDREGERQRESLVGYRNRAAERAWLDTETERQKEPG